MYNLNLLAEERSTILLAELVALLHNIGKLDPNFLAHRMKDKTEAQREVIEHLLDIPTYKYERFAAPSLDLLGADGRRIVERSEAEPEESLQTLQGEPAFRDRVLKSIEVFRDFRTKNGPLYKCFSSERPQRIADWAAALKQVREIEQSIDHLEEKLSLLVEQLNQATSHEERKPLGKSLNESKERKKELEGQLEDAERTLENEQAKLTSILEEEKDQADREDKFRDIALSVAGESWSVADLLTLFWDNPFFFKPPGDSSNERDYKRESALAPWLHVSQDIFLLALLILSHGEVVGVEKADVNYRKPSWQNLRCAKAFGYETQELSKLVLHDARHQLLEMALLACNLSLEKRGKFLESACEKLKMGLGDTRWPINEIDLWDFSSNIAALFKSGVARATIEGQIPTVEAMRWQFLSVRFDGLSYLSQVHHVTDLIGRRKTLEDGLDAVQELIEVTFPLGNEIYRDENGAVFVVPGLESQASVLTLENNAGVSLNELLQRAFAEGTAEKAAGTALAGELVPAIDVSSKVRGKQLKLGAHLRDTARPLVASPQAMADWWTGGKGREICTVCGVRPTSWGIDHLYSGERVKYYREQAEQRKVCGVCLKRRGRRAEEWASKAQDTIWIDEVADVNGRFALIVGRFGLDGWLDGSLIPTLQKKDSFARISRCWKTTREFWQDVGQKLVPEIASRWSQDDRTYQRKWPRLVLKLRNRETLKQNDHIGKYHVYETEIEGRRVSLVWNSKNEDFISAENLRYLGKQLGLKGAPWDGDEDSQLLCTLKERIEQASPLPIYEPSEYKRPTQPLEGVELEIDYVDVDAPRYDPYIPLLTEPALFMTLVPADRAMDVVTAIKEKYEREMSKVRDRLPLHLSVVIAKRRTPLRAVLEAGQAMLQWKTRWEKWKVKADPNLKNASEASSYLREGNQHFEEWLEIPLACEGREIHLKIGMRMGDGKSEDIWYPHLLTRKPEETGKLTDESWQHALVLEEGSEVWIAPSTFDFEFLDTTGRRFEIGYNTSGRRQSRSTRPLLLEEILQLQHVWDLLSKRLKTSQWMALDGLIEQKRQEWNEQEAETHSEEFKQLVDDALCNAEWRWEENDEKKKGWKGMSEEERSLLQRAALSGMLHDTVNLYHEAMKEKGE